MRKSRHRTAITISIAVMLLLVNAGTTMGRSKMTVVHATTFGAVAGDGKDDTTAVLAALEQGRKASPATLVFPKGSYDFFAGSNPKDGNTLFPINS